MGNIREKSASPAGVVSQSGLSMVFYRRLFSSVFLWGGVLWTLFSGDRQMADPVLGVLVVLMVGLGLVEYFRMLDASGIPHFKWLGLAAGTVLTAVEFLRGSGLVEVLPSGAVSNLVVILILIYALLLTGIVTTTGLKTGIIAMSTTLFGVIYVSVLFNFMMKIFFHPEVNGQLLVFYLILVTKSSDAGAYLIGSMLGKNPMIPHISPGKTWEGFAGALIIPMTFSIIMHYMSPDSLGGISWWVAGLIGVVFGAGAVTGDLVESVFKRQSGIKDSGRIFPGIGGMLDLLDSLLFNAPILYVLIELSLLGKGTPLT